MKSLDLNLLEALVALEDKRSVSAAALQLGVSQSSLSGALARLRTSLADPLFVRTGNTMQPTPRALSIARSARTLLEKVRQEIIADESFDPKITRSVVNLAMSDAGEIIFLPPLLKALRKLAPHAVVRSISVPPSGVAHGLETGEIDLAVGYFPDLKRNNFFVQTLFTDTFAGLLRANHPLASARLTMKQFLEMDHAVVQAESRTAEVIERHLAKKKIRRRITLTTPHFASVPIVVSQSDLLVTIPAPVARYFAESTANLKIIGLPFQVPHIEIRQIWHRKFHHDARNRWLRGVVAELFQRGRK